MHRQINQHRSGSGFTRANDSISRADDGAQRYREILTESADRRANDSRCFPLAGTADLTVDDSNSVLEVQLKFESKGSPPIFQEWYSTLINQYREQLKDSLVKHTIAKKDFDGQMVRLDRFRVPKQTPKKCTIEGRVMSGYTRLPVPVMP